jgi:hypothetical protein
LLADIKRLILRDYLYWKNTKVSVRDEYKIPPIVEDLNILHFTGNFLKYIIFIIIFIYFFT